MIRLSSIILLGLLFLQGCAPLEQTVVAIAAVHIYNGIAYFAAGQYDQAVAEYKATIDLNPVPILRAQALRLRAATHLRMGNYEQALEDANASINLEPTLSTSYVGRGYVHMALEQWQDAVTDFDKSIELDDQQHEAYLGRAAANANLNHLGLALTDYKTAMALAPDQQGIEHLENTIEILESRELEQIQSALSAPITPSALCTWFDDSQLLRNTRISGFSKFMAFSQQYGADGFSSVDPLVRKQLLDSLEEYLHYEHEFITAWQQLGSTPAAEDLWNAELMAEQQKLAANQKMIEGIKIEDNKLLITGAMEFLQAINLSSRTVTAMEEIREQCLDEWKTSPD